MMYAGQVSCIHMGGPIVEISNAAQRARRNSQAQSGLKEPETIDEFYNLANGFLEGMNTVEFFPNAPDCSKYSQIFMNEDNATWIDINENPDRAELDQVRMVTKLVSN